MLDSHKIVYVVSYMPSFEGASVGGFNWWPNAVDARKWLEAQLRGEVAQNMDWTHDYTLRSMPVPRDLTNVQVTELLDTELREMRELPLPAEWEQIRELGGAVELEDKE